MATRDLPNIFRFAVKFRLRLRRTSLLYHDRLIDLRLSCTIDPSSHNSSFDISLFPSCTSCIFSCSFLRQRIYPTYVLPSECSLIYTFACVCVRVSRSSNFPVENISDRRDISRVNSTRRVGIFAKRISRLRCILDR